MIQRLDALLKSRLISTDLVAQLSLFAIASLWQRYLLLEDADARRGLLAVVRELLDGAPALLALRLL